MLDLTLKLKHRHRTTSPIFVAKNIYIFFFIANITHESIISQDFDFAISIEAKVYNKATKITRVNTLMQQKQQRQ